jgi:hypothetical protein
MKKVLLLFFVLTFVSCAKKESKLVLVESNGRMNQLLLVMNNDLWDNVEGEALNEALKEAVHGLPQKEPQFNITHVEVNGFGHLFKRSKSILIVGLGDTSEFKIQTNVYAKPQTIIKLIEPNKEELLKSIKEKRAHIVQIFKNEDLKAVQYRLRKKLFDTKKLNTLTRLNVDMKIPAVYKLVDDTGEFLWLRQHIQKDQSMNLLVYELPINSKEDIEGANILSARDSIGEKYIPGEKEGMYMITEAAYKPQIIATELDGKKAFQTRGKWEVKNAFMAGPFLSYTVVDKANNRLIVAEGFTYAPATNKRDYMFEIEAVLKTLKIQ